MLGPEWREFYIRRDALVTPEGHEFRAGDLAWWSLTVRQAHEFQAIMRERRGQHRESVAAPVARARPAEALARNGDRAAAAVLTPSASEPSASQRPPPASATKDRPRPLPRADREATGVQGKGENGAVAPSAADRLLLTEPRRCPRPSRENPILGLPSSNRGVSETERIGQAQQNQALGAAALPKAGAAAPTFRLGRAVKASGGVA